MRVLLVEDEPLMADAIRDGLRLEAIAADIAGDGDQNADPFTNAVRITVSALRERLGDPWIIATVPGAGYRIGTQPDTGREGGDRG